MTFPNPTPVTGFPAVTVDEPPWPSPAGGLYAAATVIDEPATAGWGLGFQYRTVRCARGGVWPVLCPAPAGLRKEPGPPQFPLGRPFMVWDGIGECSVAGFDSEARDAAALDALERSERALVERTFHSGTAQIPGWLAGADPQAEVVTTAAVGPLQALGLLEAAIRTGYGGIGVIHAPARAAALYQSLMQILPGRPAPTTVLGNRWSFGDYPDNGPDGTPAAPGQTWIYATGAVTIRRGPVATADAFDAVANQALHLAERVVAIATECTVYAAQLDYALEG